RQALRACRERHLASRAWHSVAGARARGAPATPRGLPRPGGAPGAGGGAPGRGAPPAGAAAGRTAGVCGGGPRGGRARGGEGAGGACRWVDLVSQPAAPKAVRRARTQVARVYRHHRSSTSMPGWRGVAPRVGRAAVLWAAPAALRLPRLIGLARSKVAWVRPA